jgi:hypothetical protein
MLEVYGSGSGILKVDNLTYLGGVRIPNTDSYGKRYQKVYNIVLYKTTKCEKNSLIF